MKDNLNIEGATSHKDYYNFTDLILWIFIFILFFSILFNFFYLVRYWFFYLFFIGLIHIKRDFYIFVKSKVYFFNFIIIYFKWFKSIIKMESIYNKNIKKKYFIYKLIILINII